MARNFLRACAILIALAVALNLAPMVHAQVQQSATALVENAENIQGVAQQQNFRIVSLLEQLADEARASDDLAFAVRAQAQAATLLWVHDAELARSIYRRAFESLEAVSSSKPAVQNGNATQAEASAARRGQLRSELLNQIAARDSDLAEDLAGSFADKVDPSSSECRGGTSFDCDSNPGSFACSGSATTLTGPTREDAERRDLLMSAALQVVDREPQQAMAFAQMSVALGISSNLARLLMLMRAVDAERADLLFSNAMARLEGSPAVNLTEIHTLGSYVVSVVNSVSGRPLSRQLVVRFLKLALSKMSRDESDPSTITSRDESTAYFIGRQLTELVTRYLPDSAGRLQSYVGDNGDGEADAATLVERRDLSARAPADTARDANEAIDRNERDSLMARAALGWLAGGELKEAQEAALRISNEAIRDRVLIQIVRRYSAARRIEAGLALARRVVDVSSRADVVEMLATAALASKDEARTIDLLNEAESYSAKAPSIERARSLIRIAGSFAALDQGRSFETLQSAIKAINEIIKREQDSKDERASGTTPDGTRTFRLDDLNAASLERTLTALAKSDFERALSLAQQLPVRQASIIAQLAVCKGGLVQRPPLPRSTSGDVTEWSQNH
jgi:hypothetical protein